MTDSYTFNTPIGFLTIREEEKKLTKLFWEANSVQTMKNELHSDFLYEVYTQVNEYLTGRRKQFDVPLKYQGTQFQQSVWQELQKIPYGETRSYQEIAAAIGNEKAVRAVGQANNKNPILLIIPCHRVIHKSGDISGFACGVEVKRYLLELEKGMDSGNGKYVFRISEKRAGKAGDQSRAVMQRSVCCFRSFAL